MANSTFGEQLKREREMRGVALEEISSATRIATRFLEALENEQWDQLPGGVFNRGFVRAVARFLGLDEESLVAEYVLATNARPGATVLEEISASPDSAMRRRRWLVVLLGIALAGGGWVVWHRRGLARARQSGPPASSSQPTPPAPPAPAKDAALPAAPSAPATSSASPNVHRPASLRLTVSAGRKTEVSVIADGKRVFKTKMAAGQSRHFQAHGRFEVSAGDSGAVFLELNGQTVAPMGPPGRPGHVTLTRDDLKKTPGGFD